MHIDFEYSADKNNDSRDWSRGIGDRGRRRNVYEESEQSWHNKENLTPNRHQETNLGGSKSYILAMRSLQTKLEEKERRIKELEALLRETGVEQEQPPNLRSRQTANFGFVEKRNESRPKIEMVNVDKGIHYTTSGTERSIGKTVASTNCRCFELDSLALKFEESQREVELLKKKLQNQKDQCSQLEGSLDDNNRVSAELEAKIASKDKEIKSYKAALGKMQEVMDIIKKKKLGSLMTQNCDTNDSDSCESMVCLTKYSEEASMHKDSKKGHDSVQPSFEGIFKDILTHILLNSELTFEHLDLYGVMRERLLEYKSNFKQIENNHEFLRKTKSMLLEESKVAIS